MRIFKAYGGIEGGGGGGQRNQQNHSTYWYEATDRYCSNFIQHGDDPKSYHVVNFEFGGWQKC